MTQRKISQVGLTILGVYFLIRGIERFAVNLQYFSLRNLLDPLQFSFAWIQLIPALTSIIAGFILVGYASKIASNLFKSEDQTTASQELPPQEWYVLAFSISGIVLLAWNVLPSLINLPIQFLFPLSSEKIQEIFGPNYWARRFFYFCATLVKAGIGVYLIIRARQVAGLIIRLQSRMSAAGEANLP